MLPNLGMTVSAGQPLFSVRRGKRRVAFRAPVSGKVVNMNTSLPGSGEALEKTPYENNWICIIDADKLDAELPDLKIGNAAVAFYQEELDRFRTLSKKLTRTGHRRAATSPVRMRSVHGRAAGFRRPGLRGDRRRPSFGR